MNSFTGLLTRGGSIRNRLGNSDFRKESSRKLALVDDAGDSLPSLDMTHEMDSPVEEIGGRAYIRLDDDDGEESLSSLLNSVSEIDIEQIQRWGSCSQLSFGDLDVDVLELPVAVYDASPQVSMEDDTEDQTKSTGDDNKDRRAVLKTQKTRSRRSKSKSTSELGLLFGEVDGASGHTLARSNSLSREDKTSNHVQRRGPHHSTHKTTNQQKLDTGHARPLLSRHSSLRSSFTRSEQQNEEGQPAKPRRSSQGSHHHVQLEKLGPQPESRHKKRHISRHSSFRHVNEFEKGRHVSRHSSLRDLTGDEKGSIRHLYNKQNNHHRHHHSQQHRLHRDGSFRKATEHEESHPLSSTYETLARSQSDRRLCMRRSFSSRNRCSAGRLSCRKIVVNDKPESSDSDEDRSKV